MVEIDGTVEVVGAEGPARSLTCSRAAPSSWSTAPCGTTARRTRGSTGLYLQPLAHQGRRLPQRPRRLVRRPDLGPLGRSSSLHRVHGYTQPWYSVLLVELGPLGRRRTHHLFPARRRPRVPHLLHDRPWQRASRLVFGPARYDALWPRRGVGGQARGLAEGATVLVLALGRGRKRHLGPHQPARTARDRPGATPWRPSAGTTTTTGRTARRW